MIPYLEYNGETYEFEASLSLRREYDKATKKITTDLLKRKEISSQDLKDLEEAQNIRNELVKSGFEFTRENIEKLPEETKDKILKVYQIIEKMDTSSINEEFCFKMLNAKYGICKADWNQMLENYYNEYCDSTEEIDEMLAKVIELVFTQQVSKKKKNKMDWLKEN